jgi:hypothetical protein
MAKITLDYLEKKDLLDRFKTTAPAVDGSVKVIVNGQATINFTFDATKSEVLLKTVPTDGQAIEVSYKKITDPKLAYTLPVNKDGRNFKIMDQGTPIAFTQNGTSFTISADAFKAGKTLTLSYDVPDGSTKVFDIGRMPVAGSADVVQTVGGCDLGTGLDILDDKLISTCVVTTAMEFSLAYKYLETLKVFKVIGVENPERGNWTVYIDGESTKDYVRSGSSITLNSDPAADARIDIHYTLPE